jgi:hypothetical protein
MSIDHVLARLGLREEPQGMEAQLRNMRREVRRLSQALSNQAGHFSHDARHVADDWGDTLSGLSREAMRHGSQFAEAAGKNAWRSADAFRRDPLPAIAIVGTAWLLSRLLSK